MGYQLWISGITGHRRRGTSFADLSALFEKGLTVASISETLRCCSIDDPVPAVREELDRLHFDVAGIRAQHGPVTGWVAKLELAGALCGEHMRPFEPQQLVSDAAPLLDIVRALGDHERLYVVARRGVTGIVTRADLRKPPTRVLIFGLVSLLEMHLTYWIRKAFPDEAWRANLSQPRVDKVEALLDQRRARNENISHIDCLQLCDKKEILTKDDNVRAALGLGSRTAGARTLESIEHLRDRVAHSQEDFIAEGGWPELAATIGHVEAILQSSEAVLGAELAASVTEPPRLDAAV